MELKGRGAWGWASRIRGGCWGGGGVRGGGVGTGEPEAKQKLECSGTREGADPKMMEGS